MSARALITANRVVLAFDYSPIVVSRLKAEVPARCRAFDPERKTWTVHEPYIMPAVAIVYDTYPDLIIDDRRGLGRSWSPPTSAPRIDPDYEKLHLLPTAPAPLVDAAYKCLARLHHPDAGGDTAVMQQLNAAHDAIRSRRAS